MAKGRFYVVWKGATPGIYTSWEECQQQIAGVKQALYKSFATREEAERAYASSPHEYIGAGKKSEAVAVVHPPQIIRGALAVDAACSGNPGQMEYRGVYIATSEQIFHFGPMYGTNNIGEFLAIVHGLALLEKQNNPMPIYSDSHNALLWVKQKRCKTKLPRDEKSAELFALIDRAEKWLQTHKYKNELLKWETSQWGEIPADFGRK